MIVSMDKKYTLNGEVFTVLTVTRPGEMPVAGHVPSGRIFGFYMNGLNNFSTQLVEVSPYADFVIDEKVMVRDDDDGEWERAYFAGFDPKSGKPSASYLTVWVRGGNKANYWNECRRPTAEELAT